MKNEIVKQALEIIEEINAGKKLMTVEVSSCGHIVEEWLREYEENGYKAIKNATEDEVSEAYDECEDYGCEKITVEEVLRQIASKADCKDEHAGVERVNIWER